MGFKEKDLRLRRDIGLLGIFCIASGAMISSGLFVLPAIGFAKAGSAVILAYAIASLLVIPAVLSKAELSTAMPKAGGTYFFIDRSMGPLMGTIGGFAAWFSLAFKSAFALVGIGVFAILLSSFFQNVFLQKFIAVFCCIIFTIINLRGSKHTGKSQIIIVMGLLALLIIFIVVGLVYVDISNFENFAPYGYGSIFATAGLIFVSFGGLTKVCSVAEECKKPGRNLPLGMFLAWGIISIIYLLVIFVVIGVTPSNQLATAQGEIVSYTPLSTAANNIPLFGGIGAGIMAVAAILAFISTANAGILAASRDPMAMGKDQLIPKQFVKMSRNGTPYFSIIFTASFMICVILFLDIESLVKTASLLKILLFIFIMISLIIMRESKIRHYRPKFKSPFYPWVQIAGIFGLIFLVIEMGLIPMIIVGFFILFGFLWYWFYARDKIWREYSLLHVVERVTGEKSTGYLVDEELREILVDRDDVTEKRFQKLIKKCEILDVYKYMRPDKFAWLISNKLSDKLNVDRDKLHNLLKKRSKDSNIIAHPGIAIFSHRIKGRDKFGLIIVRSKKGIILSDDADPVHAFFVIVATPDQESFYMHSLMWTIQIAENTDFEKAWINAADEDALRDIILKSWKDRKEFD